MYDAIVDRITSPGLHIPPRPSYRPSRQCLLRQPARPVDIKPSAAHSMWPSFNSLLIRRSIEASVRSHPLSIGAGSRISDESSGDGLAGSERKAWRRQTDGLAGRRGQLSLEDASGESRTSHGGIGAGGRPEERTSSGASIHDCRWNGLKPLQKTV